MHPPSVLQDSHLVEVGDSHRQRPGSHVLSGYAYTTSQYGLTIDNVAGYGLVLPNGNCVDCDFKGRRTLVRFESR